jgi:glycosyltransferase involved in cell wall biosynthesis
VGAGVNVDDFPEPGPNKDYENHEILFVGVDFERKGGNELLAAFRIVRQTLTDARLHIVGPHRRPAGAHQEGITFHGNLSKGIRQQRDRLYRLYEQASVFVLPSKYEPFGLAPLEAMLFQVPCVVTNGWALREFVAPGINGALVDKGSVDSLAAALLRLLRSPQELSVMGKNARAMVLLNHTWPNVVSKMRTAASASLCHSAL